MGSRINNAKDAELQDVNTRLQALVVRLARIVVDRIAEGRVPRDGINRGAEPAGLETVSALRDIALECAQLARDSLEETFARALEETSVELADGAAKLEASLRSE
jgi:hypothetical protein